MIPKIIHYCWLSNDEYPTSISKCINSWKKKLPDYEIWLWDLKRFDLENSIWVRQAYENKKYAFAADFLRLYAVYNYGGVYLDSDVEVIKSFDDLLKLPYFIGLENNSNMNLEAAVIGAEPKTEWIGEVLKYYNNREFCKNGECDMKTLPEIVREIIGEIEIIKDISCFDKYSRKIQVFPKTFFSPKESGTGAMIEFTSDTYSIHHFAASWYPFRKRVFRALSIVGGEHLAITLSKIFRKLNLLN